MDRVIGLVQLSLDLGPEIYSEFASQVIMEVGDYFAIRMFIISRSYYGQSY